MSRTITDRQFYTIKGLLDLQSDLNSRIRTLIEEELIRKKMDDSTLDALLKYTQESLKNTIDEKFSYIDKLTFD